MRHRILVVDDDEDARTILREVLRCHGYAVAEAMNGRRALACLRAGWRPALVLLDLSMPVMSGWEVLEEVAADRSLDAIPIVVCTADGVGRNRVSLRACEILQKPVEIEELVRVVGRYARTARRPGTWPQVLDVARSRVAQAREAIDDSRRALETTRGLLVKVPTQPKNRD